MVPPTFLIAKCINHFLASKGTLSGILIIAFWPSAVFWPLIVDETQQFKEFVTDYIYFSSTKDLLCLGEFKGSLMASQFGDTAIFVLRLKKLSKT